MIRNVLFDAGNTLVWVDHTLLAATAGIADPDRVRDGDRMIRPVMNEHLRTRSTESRDFFRTYIGGMLIGAGLPEAELDPALMRLLAADKTLTIWRRSNPEARPAIRELRAHGIRVGVVSNSDGRVASLLEACGIGDLFEIIIDSHIEGVEKPDARIFRIACERMGIALEETAYVGDIPCIDVEGSRAVGMTPILYDPLDAFPAFADSARIRDLREIVALVARRQ